MANNTFNLEGKHVKQFAAAVQREDEQGNTYIENYDVYALYDKDNKNCTKICFAINDIDENNEAGPNHGIKFFFNNKKERGQLSIDEYHTEMASHFLSTFETIKIRKKETQIEKFVLPAEYLNFDNMKANDLVYYSNYPNGGSFISGFTPLGVRILNILNSNEPEIGFRLLKRFNFKDKQKVREHFEKSSLNLIMANLLGEGRDETDTSTGFKKNKIYNYNSREYFASYGIDKENAQVINVILNYPRAGREDFVRSYPINKMYLLNAYFEVLKLAKANNKKEIQKIANSKESNVYKRVIAEKFLSLNVNNDELKKNPTLGDVIEYYIWDIIEKRFDNDLISEFKKSPQDVNSEKYNDIYRGNTEKLSDAMLHGDLLGLLDDMGVMPDLVHKNEDIIKSEEDEITPKEPTDSSDKKEPVEPEPVPEKPTPVDEGPSPVQNDDVPKENTENDKPIEEELVEDNDQKAVEELSEKNIEIIESEPVKDIVAEKPVTEEPIIQETTEDKKVLEKKENKKDKKAVIQENKQEEQKQEKPKAQDKLNQKEPVKKDKEQTKDNHEIGQSKEVSKPKSKENIHRTEEEEKALHEFLDRHKNGLTVEGVSSSLSHFGVDAELKFFIDKYGIKAKTPDGYETEIKNILKGLESRRAYRQENKDKEAQKNNEAQKKRQQDTKVFEKRVNNIANNRTNNAASKEACEILSNTARAYERLAALAKVNIERIQDGELSPIDAVETLDNLQNGTDNISSNLKINTNRYIEDFVKENKRDFSNPTKDDLIEIIKEQTKTIDRQNDTISELTNKLATATEKLEKATDVVNALFAFVPINNLDEASKILGQLAQGNNEPQLDKAAKEIR